MTSSRDELELRLLWLAEWPGHHTLVEPSIGSTAGCPDVSLAARSPNSQFEPGWIEFKAIDPDGYVSLEPSQRFWMRNFIKHSVRCAVVSMDREGFYITHCKHFLLGSFQKAYHVPSLPSICHKITWADAPSRNLPKLVEMVYVSAQ